MGFGVGAFWGILLHFKAAVALPSHPPGKDAACSSALGTGEGLLLRSAGVGLVKLRRGKRAAGRAGQSRAGHHGHRQVRDGWSFILPQP